MEDDASLKPMPVYHVTPFSSLIQPKLHLRVNKEKLLRFRTIEV